MPRAGARAGCRHVPVRTACTCAPIVWAFGGPYGIDAAAHRGALAAAAAAVFVPASGLGQPYPAGHADLLANVAAEGRSSANGRRDVAPPEAEARRCLKPVRSRIPFVNPSCRPGTACPAGVDGLRYLPGVQSPLPDTLIGTNLHVSGTGSGGLSADRSRLHVDAIRLARVLLNVTGFSARHAVTAARRRALVPRPGPRLGKEKQSLRRWGGWDSNPRPADYEKHGSVHPCPLAAQMTRDIALMALAALGLSSEPCHEPFHARSSDGSATSCCA
jgi:DNA recombination-mediator protein A